MTSEEEPPQEPEGKPEDTPQEPEGKPEEALVGEPVVCRWCLGTGYVHAALAYVSGPDPFSGFVDTATRATQCKHCRGTGEYLSELDPTLDWVRGRPQL